MKIIKSDVAILKDSEKNGMAVSMTIIRENIESDLNKALGTYFKSKVPSYLGNFDEEDAEDILNSLNEYISKKGNDERKFAYPLGGGSDIHLLEITENLKLKILIVDEYHGDGESETYIMSDVFLINERTTTRDVDILVEFIHKYFG